MDNIFPPDFRDFINALNDQQVKYLLVGGYAVILHGYARTTGDLDIWVEQTSLNYSHLRNAFDQFGMSVFEMTEENFLSHPEWEVFTFGEPPVAIDLMTKVKGLEFESCYPQSVLFEEGEFKARTLDINSLILSKKITGRPKDLNDLENIQ
jgi:hypothetical protein